MNDGLLPPDYYAMVEQVAGGFGLDILSLGGPDRDTDLSIERDDKSTTTLTMAAPKVKLRVQGREERYAKKTKSVVVKHISGHQVIAIVEIVSPGNKNSRHGLLSFLRKVDELLRAGIHLLILDLHPPGPRDPQGIHKAIWDAMYDNDFVLPSDTPLTLVSYRADQPPEAFIEPTAVGLELNPMPLFLDPSAYITLPLEASYQSAWEAVPRFWREVVEGTRQA